jgi:hypothetical protein
MYEPKYWNGEGKYQKQHSEIFNRLVPSEGKAKTKAGEILRMVSSIYYDQFNNGGCNLWEGRREDVNGLHYLVPDEKKGEAMRFSVPLDVMREDVSDSAYENWLKDLDAFVDWVVQYVAEIENKEGLPC